MISETIRYRSSRKKLLIITVCILMFIICVTTTLRSSIKQNGEGKITASPASIELFMDQGLNVPEIRVLLSISDWVDSPEQNITYRIFYDSLKEYYGSPGVDLSAGKALAIEALIDSRNEIVYLEGESRVNKMSFDGREVVIYLLKQIYDISGMKLVINEAGDIETITDLSGNIIFIKDNRILQTGFSIDALIISITLIAALFGICVYIARKNQLLVKGRDYDGFDEEEFA